MQRKIRTATAPIQKTVKVPGSPSITLRALLLAALADGVSEITGMHANQETRSFVTALQQLGIVTQFDETHRSCIIAGCNGNFPRKQTTINCDASKAISRFLLASCAGLTGAFYLDGSEKMLSLADTEFLKILACQGAQFIPNDAPGLPFTLIGTDSFEGGDIFFDRTVSSQIISALLMVSPFARTPFTFNLCSDSKSSSKQHYIDMTCNLMGEFGVLVRRIHHGQLMVPVPQRYNARDYAIEPDFASAAYFFAAAAITGGEMIIPLAKRAASKQEDATFLSVLEKMGCYLHETKSGLLLRGPTTLAGVEISITDLPSIFPALIAIAPFASSPVVISDLEHASQRELKRLSGTLSELIKLGMPFENGINSVKILPSKLKGGTVNAEHDHHIAMAGALIGLKVPGVVINQAECVETIFPEFFTVWNNLTEPAEVVDNAY